MSIRFSVPASVRTGVDVGAITHRDLLSSGNVAVIVYHGDESVIKIDRDGEDFRLRSTITGEARLSIADTDAARLRAHVEGFSETTLASLRRTSGAAEFSSAIIIG